MPTRRGFRQKGAVTSLAGSRLPVGTPSVPDLRSEHSLQPPTPSRNSHRPNSAASSRTDVDSTDHHHHSMLSNPIDMVAPTPNVLSLAEARLRRQNERIQQADPTIVHPLVSDRARPISRAKGKPAQHNLDPSNNSSRERDPSDGGVPVSEVRINTYHTSHDGNLPARPYSSLSQHTASTTASGSKAIERLDGATIDDAGFQIIARRGNRRIVSELGAYEEKPEEKQATVEATVDQKEILKVFAIVLPGIDFLNSFVGHREGQVQFIQHPNGDVSAHIWSNTSNVWDNLGHFSNIRKKIEGQLAGDQLKGETAYQKMQQNTLAYFRTIAKQREAYMGDLEFGQPEIKQLLPEPVKKPSPPIISKEPAKVSPPVVKSTSRVQASAPPFQPSVSAFKASSYQELLAHTQAPNMDPYYPVAVPRMTADSDYSLYYTSPPRQQAGKIDMASYYPAVPTRSVAPKIEDPFNIPAASYADLYNKSGPEYRGGTVAGPARKPPPAPAGSCGLHHPGGSARFPFKEPLPMPYKFPAENSPPCSTRLNTLPYDFEPPRVAGTGPTAAERRNLSIVSNDASHPNHSNPILLHRENMREKLFAISDRAVSRSQSRDNLVSMSGGSARRSFMHDPFQADDSGDENVYQTPSRQTHGGGKAAQLNSILARHRPAENSAVTPLRHFSASDMPIGWIDSQLTPQPVADKEDILADSTPDYDASNRIPLARRFISESHGFNADPRACWPFVKPAMNMTPEEELRDWWTSGNKFARQESYYQSIKALSAVPATSPPAMQEKEKLYRIANPSQPSPSTAGQGGVSTENSSPSTTTQPTPTTKDDFLTRLLIPVYENLLGYVDGPPERRRDYWCHWKQAPEWAVDRSGNGNDSFFETPGLSPVKTRGAECRADSRAAGVAVPIGAGLRGRW
ncbi:unnamed protein product [Zymoseptoria tritici ST99CH_3D7]|uniref:Uncharacterized protein n=1 Tax=Zymoseptoria tritici (strain ST99CH_3D7) TaxID=1276538 RepID=A0A1X7S976_ZYMT9|nr:unnamed protein product [Zymoseptoria tritici ST99CH_3D7]